MKIQIALNTDFDKYDNKKSTLTKIYHSNQLKFMTFEDILEDIARSGSIESTGHQRDLKTRTNRLYCHLPGR